MANYLRRQIICESQPASFSDFEISEPPINLLAVTCSTSRARQQTLDQSPSIWPGTRQAMLQAGWEAMLRHAALVTAWLLHYLPQSWRPDPAGALFASLVLLTALGSLLVWNAPYVCLFYLRPKATANNPQGEPRGWEEFREALGTMAFQVLFLWALLCFGGSSAAMLHHRPEWREALEGYLFQDAEKAAATAALLSFPPWPQMLRELLVCLLVEDTLFYWFHRAFHHPWLYATFHKTHHHFKAPFSVGSTYTGLVDFAIGASVPLVVGLIVACSSLPSVMACGAARLYFTTETHSGYAFPWSLDGLLRRLLRSGARDYFLIGALHHDLHHERTHGNYALSFVHWDVLCGTLLLPPAPASKERAPSSHRGDGRAKGDDEQAQRQ